MNLPLPKSTLRLVSHPLELNLPITSRETRDIVAATRPLLADYQILDMLETDTFFFSEQLEISDELTTVLSCFLPDVLRANRISSIKLIRHLTNCGLKEAKDALESHLERVS